MAANLNDTTPAASAGRVNVAWQKDVLGNVSASVATGAGGTVKYTTSWVAQTSVTVTHNIGSTAVTVQVYDGGSPNIQVQPESITITSANVVTLTFGGAFTGYVVVIG